MSFLSLSLYLSKMFDIPRNEHEDKQDALELEEFLTRAKHQSLSPTDFVINHD